MEVHKALDQISEIHEHLTRAELYRGYRSVPIALSGFLALIAAAVQPRFAGAESPTAFVGYWVVVGILGILLAGGGVVYNYRKEESCRARRMTRIVVGQLLPCLVAGAMLAFLMGIANQQTVAFLPGLWCILYSLGVFASRPYLPRMTGWVGLFFLIAGGVLLALAPAGSSLSPWGMGLTFGMGQVFGAVILYWNLERNHGSQKG